MSTLVSVDDLADAIQDELEKYREDVTDGVKKSVQAAAKQCRDEIKDNSPVLRRKRAPPPPQNPLNRQRRMRQNCPARCPLPRRQPKLPRPARMRQYRPQTMPCKRQRQTDICRWASIQRLGI